MRTSILLLAVTVFSLGCPDAAKPARRAEVRRVTGNSLQIVPTAGQLPYCLVYTVAEKGVIRQLTMNARNESVPCEADRPISNVAFRIPVEEGKVKLLVIFSDRKLNAGSIAQQIYEVATKGDLLALNLRAPGQVMTEREEFLPQDDGTQPATGGVVSSAGTVNESEKAQPAGDGGSGATEAATNSTPTH